MFYYLFVFAKLSPEEAGHLYFPAFGISSINWCDVIRSYKCFQYTNKLRHNVVYVFSIFYDVIFGQLPIGYGDFIHRSTNPNF